MCDRVVNVNDFKDFIKELGNLSGENVVPYFVKNILALNACRYAIMFGDELSQETQINLIESLAKCELCFICAHGRPSVIPLFDMNTKSHSSATEGTSARADKEGELNLSKGENCGPKRIIRR